MAHRLLHTLAFSSSLLLEGAFAVGCGGSDATSASTTPPAARETARAEPTAPTSGGARVAEAALPGCDEVGWPSTKGATCEVDTSGIRVCTSALGSTTRCAVNAPAQP